MPTDPALTLLRQAVTGTYTAPPPLPVYSDPFIEQEMADKERRMAAFSPSGWEPPRPTAPPPAPVTDYMRRAMAFSKAPIFDERTMQEGAERLQEAETAVPSGAKEAWAGASDIAQNGPSWRGAGKVARGLMKVGTPLLGAGLAAPIPVAIGLTSGTAAGYGGTKAATAMGAEPQTAQDIGDVLALATGLLTSTAAGIRAYGAARTAAEMTRAADLALAKVPEATPAEAAALRAKAAALVQSANELAPVKAPPTAPPVVDKKPNLPQGPIEILAPPEPTPTPAAASVEKTRVSQLVDQVRTARQAQRAAGIEPQRHLSSEAGVLKLPTPEEVSAARQWTKTRLFDEYAPIQDLAKRGPLTKAEDPYIAARMFAGHYGKIWDAHEKLRAIAKPVNDAKLMKPWERILNLRRDQEQFGRPDLPDYKSPIATDATDAAVKIDQIRNALSPEELALLDQKSSDLYAELARRFEEYKDSGMISQEAFDAARANNQFYVPFHRVTHLKPWDEIPVGGRVLDVKNQRVVKAIEGSEAETAPVLESISRNIRRMVADGQKNLAMQKLAALSERPQWETVVRPLAAGEAPGAGEGRFSVFIDGAKQEYAIPKEVEGAIQGVKPREVDTLQRIFDFTNQGVRSGATMYYLPFLVKNAIRDYRTALLRSPIGFGPQDWAYGFANAIKRGSEFAEYMRSGAAQSGFFERDVKVSKEAKHIVESTPMRIVRNALGPHFINPLHAMRLLSETIELAPRVGIYKRALNAGMSDLEAAWLARNVTQDFSSIGTWMKKWNAMTPFVNARLHGSANIFAALRDNPARAALWVGATTILPTIYLHYHNQLMFPDVLAQIPPQEQGQNQLLIYGREKDKKGNFTQVLKFPKSDYDRYFGNPIDNFMHWMYRTNPKAWWQSLIEFASDVSPVSFMNQGEFAPLRAAAEALPPAAGVVAEELKNQDFYTGYPINPGSTEGADSAEQWGTTPETLGLEKTWTGRRLIDLSHLLKFGSPLQYRHFLRRMGGGAGRLLTSPPEEDTTTAHAASLTGAERVKSMFVGARGGAEEERLNKALAPFRRQARTEEVVQLRNFTRVMDVVKDTPEDDRMDVIFDAFEGVGPWKGKEIDRTSTLRALNEVAAEAVGLTPGQAAIRRANPHAKALYLLSLQEQMPEAQYQDFEDKMVDLGYVDAAVFRDMNQTVAEREMRADAAAGASASAAPPAAAAAAPPAAGASVADRNNNPLNLRGEGGRFQVFSSPEEGWAAGKSDLLAKMAGRSQVIDPNAPLSRLFEVWAPAGDGDNDPTAYGEYVTVRTRIPLTTPIKNLIGRVDEVAQAMAEFEGWHGGGTRTNAALEAMREAIRNRR